MPYDTPAIDSPTDLLALAATRTDKYLTETDLERDFDSRCLTTRYLIETVAALHDIACGHLTDQTRGVAYDHDRLKLAVLLLPTLEHESLVVEDDDLGKPWMTVELRTTAGDRVHDRQVTRASSS